MKKILLILLLGMFMVSFVSALEFDNVKEFNKENLKYGKIEIINAFGFGEKLAEYTLERNTDQCLINCYAEGTTILYKKNKLFSDFKFKGKDNKYKNLKSNKVLIKVNQSYQQEFNQYYYYNITNSNGTVEQKSDLISTYYETKYKMVWEDYNFEILDIGNYSWRIEGKKNKIGSIDWIGTSFGKDLTNWAWWNNDWQKKKEIKIQENSGTNLTNYSILINVTYDSDMKTDFGDLRFLNSTENGELDYWIDKKIDSTWASVWVKVTSLTENINTSIYMYYNNSAVSTTSNFTNSFLFADDFEDGTNGVAPTGWTIQESTGTIRVSTASANTGTKSVKIDDTGSNPSRLYGYVQLPNDLNSAVLHFSQSRNTGSSYQHTGLDDSTLETAPTGVLPASWGLGGGTTWNYYSSGGAVSGGEVASSGWGNFSMTVNLTDYLDISQNGTTQVGVDALNSIPDLYRYLQIWGSAGGATGSAYFDDIYVRNFANPEPTYIIGAEQITGMNITLNSPINNFNTVNQTIIFNGSVIASINSILNVSLILDGIYNETNTSGVNNTNYLFTKIISDGSHNWTYEGCNVEGCVSETIRTFTIDSTLPIINISSPTGILDINIIGQSETLNVTFIDSNLDTCWYNYNGTNITIGGCLTGVLNSTQFILEEGNTNLTAYSNDTLGNFNSSFTSWDYKVLEINQTYNNETTEGGLETFLALIKLGSGYSISDIHLFYNDSSNTAQSFASGQNTVLRKIDFTIPNVETDTNLSFYWHIILSDSSEVNLSLQNQTIYNLNLDNCSSFTNELYNFTVVDEELQTILPNATIETAINIYDETRTILVLNHSDIYEAINPLRICLNRNISNSIYSVDVIIRYEDTGFANEYYNIVNSTLTNSTSSQTITLYDLNSTDSTEFQLTFTGADFLPIENALVYVDRQYISENTFKTVELPKTDYNGQTVLHLVRNDIIYNIRITKNGVVLGNFENLIAFCEDFTIGDCNIDLNAFDSVESIFNYDSSIGIIYSNPTYNTTTNKVNFVFVTSDGTSKTVVLEVLRNDIFGNRSVCNASLISSGGTLNCDVNPNIDNSTLKINVYVDSILEVKSSVNIDTTNYGVAGYLIMFIMAISFVLMFSGSKTGVLVSIGLTLASAIGMGLVSGSLIGVGASGIWLLVIIFIGIYKLNSERPA